MRDISSTSFGFLIAFLLPGITGLLAVSFWVEPLQDVFVTFESAESNVGLFLLVLLFALALGLEINLVRWVVFEKWLCRNARLDPEDFKALGDQATLSAFRAAADEHYRYHQFWGCMSIILPFILIGSGPLFLTRTGIGVQAAYWFFSVLIEAITIIAAREAYLNYVRRARNILKGA